MALSLDTTVAGSAANSYASLAEAAAYFEAVPSFAATWAELTEEQQAAWLIEAARAVDRHDFLGQRYEQDQALAFPRRLPDGSVAATDIEGVLIVPATVKAAQLEAVRWLKREMADDDSADDRAAEEVSLAGAVALDFGQNRPSNLAGGTGPAIRALLRDYLTGSSRRLRRA